MSCDMGDMNDMTPNFDVLKKN
ncbi:Hypothetical protein Cp106_0073 [Corynebacterium pseudotuberculosis 1/06-A]|nr:Hypothetical protein Cp106_0073 [Corynebacterium pseudotuberculosis 1/06-A]